MVERATGEARHLDRIRTPARLDERDVEGRAHLDERPPDARERRARRPGAPRPRASPVNVRGASDTVGSGGGRRPHVAAGAPPASHVTSARRTHVAASE